MESLREVEPGGHHLGTPHTISNFTNAFHRSELLDYKDIDEWTESGSPTAVQNATKKVAQLLRDYQAPALDEDLDQALLAFIQSRKDEISTP
jgi:trimethylamine--corrinoid protein Co-methyltransferase